MLRNILIPALVVISLAGAGLAQPRDQQRDDLLDALTRHIQLCTEIGDGQGRLACFDRLQTRVGDVQPSSAAQPVPLRPLGASPPIVSDAPAPSPLVTPGDGVATLGGTAPEVQAGPPPAMQDPDRAFDPRSSTYRPPEALAPKPQPAVRRTGPRAIPSWGRPMPLLSLDAQNLTYGEARYWQVTIIITSNTAQPLNTQVRCTFTNNGKVVEESYYGPVPIQPGEQISTEMIGPPTTAYVDSTNCRVVSP